MKVNPRINNFRQKALRNLARNIGSDRQPDISASESSSLKIQKILVCRPNGRLGNQLLITPLIQELTQHFPDCTIDLFVRGNIASILFQNYRQVDRIIRLPGKPFDHLREYLAVWFKLRKGKYDLVVNTTPNSSSGRLATRLAKGKYKMFGDNTPAETAEIKHIAKKPVADLRSYLNVKTDRLIPGMDIRLSEEELEAGKHIIRNLFSNQKKTITLYTFATGPKCYSKEWWKPLYNKLKDRFDEDYNFLEILPVENVSQIDFCEVSFYSRDLREIAAVMANTEMYVGGDCGMMHLAGAAKIPVVGFFSVTSPEVYGVYGNHSKAIDTNKTGQDGILACIEDILQKSFN